MTLVVYLYPYIHFTPSAIPRSDHDIRYNSWVIKVIYIIYVCIYIYVNIYICIIYVNIYIYMYVMLCDMM